jgi:DNA-binding response OmpR family regulator
MGDRASDGALAVLVVTSDAVLRDLLLLALRRAGHVADGAADGAEALAALARRPGAALVLDAAAALDPDGAPTAWLRTWRRACGAAAAVVLLAPPGQPGLEALAPCTTLTTPFAIEDLLGALARQTA